MRSNRKHDTPNYREFHDESLKKEELSIMKVEGNFDEKLRPPFFMAHPLVEKNETFSGVTCKSDRS